MRINFRQGIISAQNEFGGFLKVNPTTVDLLTSNRQLTLTVAQGSYNYTHVETAPVTGAWDVGYSTAGGPYWLYWDFHKVTFARSFGSTNLQPVSQATAPSIPNTGQHWFDTVNDRQMVYNAGVWTEVLRVFAARLEDSEVFSMSINAPSFYGTQVGDTSSIRTGRVMFDESSNSVRRDNGTFITTEDQLFASGSRVDGIRLESNVDFVTMLSVSAAAYMVVSYDSNGTGVNLAQYDDTGSTVLGILTEDILAGGVGTVVLQGVVTNSGWNWPLFGAPVGSELWVSNGNLVAVDPHVSNVSLYPTSQVPVARVLARDQVIFEQGLGGVGARGPTGSIDNLPVAQKIVDVTTDADALGAVTLADRGTVVTPATPEVLHTGDPMVISWDTTPTGFLKAGDTIPANLIIFTPAGDLIAQDVQAAVEELDNEKVAKAGDVMASAADLVFVGGGEVLGLPVIPSSTAATSKEYVDGKLVGLGWVDPIDGYINLIDDTLSAPPASPFTSDVYIVSGTGTGLWTGWNDGQVVHAIGGSPNPWTNLGLISTFATGTRFGISMNSPTAAGSGFTKDHIYELTDPNTGTFTDTNDTVDQAAVFISNPDSLNAFHQYTYTAGSPTDGWTEFGGGIPQTAGENISVSNNVWNVLDYSNGGVIEAATVKGLDFNYTPTSVTGWGSPINSVQLTATTDAKDALDELRDTKAQKAPEYAILSDLPIASTVVGMVAHVTAEDRLYHSGGSPAAWIPLMNVNDTFFIPFDLMFYLSDQISQVDNVLGAFVATRTITAPLNFTGSLAVADTAATTESIFDILVNGIVVGEITFAALGASGTFASVGSPLTALSMVPGDVMKILSPSGTADATIADIAVTVAATATSSTSDTLS